MLHPPFGKAYSIVLPALAIPSLIPLSSIVPICSANWCRHIPPSPHIVFQLLSGYVGALYNQQWKVHWQMIFQFNARCLGADCMTGAAFNKADNKSVDLTNYCLARALVASHRTYQLMNLLQGNWFSEPRKFNKKVKCIVSAVACHSIVLFLSSTASTGICSAPL